MDQLQTMSVFVGVAEEGGFAPASRRLNMSPPTVTRAVAELEARIGVPLLHRTTRSMRLTNAGHQYLADCQRILSSVDEADQHASGIHAAPRGMVLVSASALFGRLFVAPILLDLLDLYPDISITTLFVNRIVHLFDEGIDIAVRFGELPDSALSAVRVGSVRCVLCASPDYFGKRGRPNAPSELTGHDIVDFVDLTTSREWTFVKDGQSHSFRPRSRLRVNIADPAINAAVDGRGITRVLSYTIAPQLNSRELEIVLEDYEPPAVPIHILHKEPGQTSARVRAVVDYLVQRLRTDPALAH